MENNKITAGEVKFEPVSLSTGGQILVNPRNLTENCVTTSLTDNLSLFPPSELAIIFHENVIRKTKNFMSTNPYLMVHAEKLHTGLGDSDAN